MPVFPGFNSNIRHRGKVYHLQTEVNTVRGLHNISTLVYLGGEIYHSTKTALTEEQAVNEEAAAPYIRSQHQEIARLLLSGELVTETVTKEDLAEIIIDDAPPPLDFMDLYKNEAYLKNKPLQIDSLAMAIRSLVKQTVENT